MAEYLIQEETLIEIANAVRAKTEKTDAILVSNLADEIANISTGVELNFEIIGDTNEPINPKENTLWVNTDVEISGWVFSAVQPTEYTEGLVWIVTGTSSIMTFNALKTNGIQIYLNEAMQYIGGAWVGKDVKIYQGGKWNGLVSAKYLFKSGEGTLVPFTESIQSGDHYYIDINSDFIEVHSYITDSNADNASVYTTSKVDLSGYRTLYFDVEVMGAWEGEEPTFGVASAAIPNDASGYKKFIRKQVVDVCDRKTIEVDISGVDSGYVGAWACGNFIIYNIWCE